MIETVFGGLLGGALRLTPEILKHFDRKNERTHELSMQDKQLEFEKINQQGRLEEIRGMTDVAQIQTMGEAFKQQASADKNSYKWVASVSSLVRPIVTFSVVGLYMFCRIQNPYEFGAADHALLSSIIGFWFVSRSIKK